VVFLIPSIRLSPDDATSPSQILLFVWIFFLSACHLSAQTFDSSLDPLPLDSARVVIVHDPAATATYIPQQGPIETMIERGLTQLWETPNSRAGWQSLIDSTDVVGIRIHSSTGKTSGTRPTVVSALVRSLIKSGHPAKQIIVWDRQLSSLRAAGYLSLKSSLGIQVLGARDLGYDGDTFYESSIIGTMIWGDHEFGEKGEGRGKKSFVSQLLTHQITKIINVTPLLNHNRAGVYGNLVGLAMASVDNTIRFQGDPDRLDIAIPEINALAEIGDRVILNVVDALIAQYQGQTQARLQDSAVLNELRFSRDPVALDVLSIAELERQRELKEIDLAPSQSSLYENATLLEIGVSDPSLIHIETLRSAP
jgi:hypothetical protein